MCLHFPCGLYIAFFAYLLRVGYHHELQGRKRVVKAGVLCSLADTVAAHSLGGFKVGMGFLLRICHNCLTTRTQASTKVIITITN